MKNPYRMDADGDTKIPAKLIPLLVLMTKRELEFEELIDIVKPIEQYEREHYIKKIIRYSYALASVLSDINEINSLKINVSHLSSFSDCLSYQGGNL